jgi:hypothetical protein
MQLSSDLKHLLELLPSDDRSRPEIARKLKGVEPRIAIAQKSETDEMLTKLKELGNNILGEPRRKNRA